MRKQSISADNSLRIYIEDLGEWVALCDDGFFESGSSEEAVDQAKPNFEQNRTVVQITRAAVFL